jgi:hypothetical protein
MTQATAAATAAAGSRDPNFRACLFGYREIVGPCFTPIVSRKKLSAP